MATKAHTYKNRPYQEQMARGLGESFIKAADAVQKKEKKERKEKLKHVKVKFGLLSPSFYHTQKRKEIKEPQEKKNRKKYKFEENNNVWNGARIYTEKYKHLPGWENGRAGFREERKKHMHPRLSPYFLLGSPPNLIYKKPKETKESQETKETKNQRNTETVEYRPDGTSYKSKVVYVGGRRRKTRRKRKRKTRRRKTKRRKYRRGTKRRRKRTRRRRGKGLISSMGKHVIKGSNALMSLTPQGQVTKLSTKAMCNRKNPPPVCKSMTLTPEQRANIVEQKLTGGLI